MAGRPRQNRESIKATHLSIRLTDSEVAVLDALAVKANADRAKQYPLDLERWEQRSYAAKSVYAKPEPPKPATYADVVRALLQQEAHVPRLYEKGLWTELKQDTEPLDRLVDLANDKEPAGYRWTREAMLRRLIEDEFGRRRLKKAAMDGSRRSSLAHAHTVREEEWRTQQKHAQPSGTMPLAVCPQCGSSFELPHR